MKPSKFLLVFPVRRLFGRLFQPANNRLTPGSFRLDAEPFLVPQ
jgi:hypothetical protein